MNSSLENAKNLFELGLSYFKENLFIKAENLFKQALELAPDRESILINLSATLIQLGKFDECIDICKKILGQNAHNYDALVNLGICFSNTKLNENALILIDKAIQILPSNEKAWINKGNILRKINLHSQAIDCLNKAIELNPRSEEALIGRGLVMFDEKNYQESLINFNKCLSINQNNHHAKWNKALLLLHLGDYKNGWPLYESRWQIHGMQNRPIFSALLWLGQESLVNKSILIHFEQGYGDCIQFSRFITRLEAMGAKEVILQTPKSLSRLMKSLSSSIKVIDTNQISKTDFHCPILSLPFALGISLKDLPGNIPYLFPSALDIKKWRERLNHISQAKHEKKAVIRVGLAWYGSGHYAGEKNFKRNIPHSLMSDFLEKVHQHFPKLEFHSLHIEQVCLFSNTNILTHDTFLTDFADTAALINCLDLVITIDTAIAHLSGAIGKKTILLLPNPPDYLSPPLGDKTPWYPSTKIIRQTVNNSWSEPLEKVIFGIEDFIQNRS